MKKSIFCFVLLSLFLYPPIQIKAQTGKGRLLLGGHYGLNFSSSTQTYKSTNVSNVWNKTRSLEVTPQIGYFLSGNFPAGLELLYDYKYTGITKNNYSFSSSFSLLPFLRYYVGGTKTKIKPFLHAAIGPGWKKDVSRDGDFPKSIHNSKLFVYELSGGIGIFLNEQLSIDFSFGYHSTTEYHKEPMENGTFDKWRNISKGPGAKIGLMFYL